MSSGPGNEEKTPAQAPSAFAPFAHSAFALLWTATLLSNMGTWMHDVTAAWLMTSLSPSPFVVSLVQAATTGAMALFALPAGAMADLFDRRKLLIGLKIIAALLTAVLSAITMLGLVEAWSLLLITFLMGVCGALASPVWQAIVPSLVPRHVVPQAVAMNSMGINVARAIGPAVGGVLIVSLGAGAVFALNGASELIIIAALLVWKPAAAPTRSTPPEAFVPAIVAGLRYASASPLLKPVLLRAAAFFLFGSAFWSLLPLIARDLLKGGAELYGLLVSAVGVGAVAAAFALPWLKRHLRGTDRVVMAGSLGLGAVLALLALVPVPAVALGLCVLTGVFWIIVLSSLNAAAQGALPDWVRGRGLSIYGLVFFGSMTVGSLTWGASASAAGLVPALLCSAAGMVLGVVASRKPALEDVHTDLSPSGHWPEPVAALPLTGEHGHVLVTVEYHVAATNHAAFLAALQVLSAERRRNGAYSWSVHEDAAAPGRFVETFKEASWTDHQRHHDRVTKADRDAQQAVLTFHTGASSPVVTHMLERG